MRIETGTRNSKRVAAAVVGLLAAVSAGCERRVASAAPPQPPTVEVG